MYIGEKMSLKIGDKVKMTNRGFKFYGNVNIQFDMFNVGGKMEYKHFESALCKSKAIHGIGTIKRFNTEGDPYVRWENSLDGINYFYTHYFDKRDVAKLTLLDKIKLKLRSLL
jgi:hypothetical protein